MNQARFLGRLDRNPQALIGAWLELNYRDPVTQWNVCTISEIIDVRARKVLVTHISANLTRHIPIAMWFNAEWLKHISFYLGRRKDFEWVWEGMLVRAKFGRKVLAHITAFEGTFVRIDYAAPPLFTRGPQALVTRVDFRSIRSRFEPSGNNSIEDFERVARRWRTMPDGTIGLDFPRPPPVMFPRPKAPPVQEEPRVIGVSAWDRLRPKPG